MKNRKILPWLITILLLYPLLSISTGTTISNKYDLTNSFNGLHQFRGWSIETEFSIRSSPVIADLDGDNFQEIIVVTGRDYHGSDPEYSSRLRKIYVWDSNGNLKNGWPKNISSKNNRPPSVGDLDGDGDLEIILFSRGFIYAWHHDGSDVNGWPIPFSSWQVGVPPTMVDLNNDNLPEVIVSAVPLSKSVQIYDSNGNILPNWPQPYLGNFYGAVGNLDLDSEKEFVISSRASGGLSSITCLNMDGAVLPGWPKTSSDLNMPDGSVVLGDLDDDGINEIIFPTMDAKVYVLKANGDNFPNWPINLEDYVVPSLVLGDLDTDGDPDIIGIESFDGCGTARVHAWNADGTELDGFPVKVYLPPKRINRWTSNSGAPIILDIDGDNYQEIVCVFQQWGLKAPSYIFVIEHNGKIREDFFWPIHQGFGLWQQHSSLAAGDIDNDGMLELVSAYSKHNPDYPDISYGGGEVVVYNLNAPLNPSLMDWPMFQHDSQHTGLYLPSERPCVKIVKPKQRYFYISDKEILQTPLFGCTIIVAPITIEATTSDNITKVEFYIDNKLKETVESEPFIWTWRRGGLIKHRHTIKVIAYDEDENSTSDELTVWKFF